jgi:hypothetical protein
MFKHLIYIGLIAADNIKVDFPTAMHGNVNDGNLETPH